MRTCLALFLLFGVLLLLFPVTAKGQNIATEKVTFGLKDESLETAIKKIEGQTSLRFFYHNGDIAPLAHLNLITGSRTIQQTLEILLQNTHLTFRQMGNNILLERRGPQAFYEISGRVVDSADKTPIANASVFINNSTIGAITGNNGSFKLSIATPGKYELVVSFIGYAGYKKTLFIENDISLPVIEIAGRAVKLSEVKVKPDPGWDKNYKWFAADFLGTWNMAGKCLILNPEVLDLNCDEKKGALTASSTCPLEIENQVLGYKLKYVLDWFQSNKKTGKVNFKGSAWFEPLTGDLGWQQLWQKNRDKAYKGSMMHFLRAALENRLSAEGFKVLRLKRAAKPGYKGGSAFKYSETLGKTYLQADDFVKLTNKRGVYALSFKDRLYVMYTKIHNYTGSLTSIPFFEQPDFAKTTLTITGPYTFFDNNGIVLNPESVVFDGYWAQSRVARLLPSDYYPAD